MERGVSLGKLENHTDHRKMRRKSMETLENNNEKICLRGTENYAAALYHFVPTLPVPTGVAAPMHWSHLVCKVGIPW